MPTKDDKTPLTAAEMLADDPNTAAVVQIDEDPAPAETLADAVAAEDEPRLHPILTNAEVREAQEKAHKRVAADSKKEAMKAVEEAAYLKERGSPNLRTGDPVRDELVDIALDLAEHSDRITLNGMSYMHGQTYTVPRHIADTLREIQSRGHDHQTDLDGKGLAERMRKPRATVFNAKSGAVINGPQAMH
jgi:hypothetical protein